MKARPTKHGEVSKIVPVKRLEQECPQKIRREVENEISNAEKRHVKSNSKVSARVIATKARVISHN